VNDVVTGFKWIGTRPIRPDGVPKVTGRAMYAADLAMPGQLGGDQYRQGSGAARGQGRHNGERFPGAEIRIHRPGAGRGQFLACDPQHHGAREDAL